LLSCLAVITVADASIAQALANSDIVINEVVAANDTYNDNYGETPDWIELQNNGSALVSLAGRFRSQ